MKPYSNKQFYREQFYKSELATKNSEPGFQWQAALRLAIQDICLLAGWEEPYGAGWGTYPPPEKEQADDSNQS